MKPTKLTNDLQIFTTSMGKIFKVSAVCSNDDEANEFCRKNKDSGVIAVDNNGYIYIAELYGKTIKSSELKQFTGSTSTDAIIAAIEQFAISIDQQEEPKVLMPPESWSKYRRMLKVAGIKYSFNNNDTNLDDVYEPWQDEYERRDCKD